MYFQMGEAGKRARWNVKVPAAKLKACCEERIAYHKRRGAFWNEAHRTAEAKLRSEGIQIKQGSSRTEATLDAGLANRVAECERRTVSHTDSLNRFVAFKALLSVAGNDEMWELNVDDVLYFNLEGADIGGDD